MYQDYDYGDYDPDDGEEEESPFGGPVDEEKTAPALPEIKMDVPPEALRHILRDHVRSSLPAAAVRDMARKHVEAILDAELDAWIRKAIGKEVTGLIEEYFTKERTQTNQWGEGIGGYEALGDAVVQKVKSYLAASERHAGNSRLDAMVDEILFKPLEKQLKKELEKVRADQAEKATAFVARMMADSMKVIGGS